jgi:hypothetical protein
LDGKYYIKTNLTNLNTLSKGVFFLWRMTLTLTTT